MEPRFEFREVNSLTAGSVGAPGQRTFYVLVGQGDTWVRLWVEKEQLQSLSLAITQLLSLWPERTPKSAETPVPAPVDPRLADDFKVSRLALGYDEAREMGVIYAYSSEATDDSLPTVTSWATREQMRALSEQSAEVCSAGRPNCRLCGQPIDPEGHVCPRRNGHRYTVLREDQEP